MKNFIKSILILAAVFKSATRAEVEELVYVQLGDKVILKPPVVANLQDHYLYWFFEGENGPKLAWRNIFGGKKLIGDESWNKRVSLSDDDSLVITDIQQEQFGTVICVVNKDDQKHLRTYKLLKVNVAMDPTSPLVPGESLTLTCSEETPNIYRKPAIHWLSPQGKKIKANRGRITARVTGQDDGQWACVVTNNNKESKANISVTVVDLSPAPDHLQYTSTSSPLTIPCSIPAHITWEKVKAVNIQEVNWYFFPKPNDSQRLFYLNPIDPPTWTKDQGRDLTHVPDLKKGVLSLTRKLGRKDDKGDYVCSMKVRNGVTLNVTVHVKVLQITSSPAAGIISGQQVDLTCGLGESLHSDLKLKWVPPRQSPLPPLKPDHHPAQLIIPEVGTGHEGKWRCELWQGNKTLTSAAIALKIERKLSVWMLVIICSVTVIVVLLLLLLFIIYRRRHKSKHIRHRLCKCKNPKPKGFYRT
ncbi:CD4-1 molecule [Cheilinus undulatus]|uniref:CD4-1 molecule n=1 Tax=Cheilinus undulatus TaxID=241271 RepID=UPI001BD33271|nr:CD4-1 molecule [Cheilinus undulatus]